MAGNINIDALLQAPRAGVRPLPVHIGAVLAGYAKNPAQYAQLTTATCRRSVAGIKAYQAHPFRRSMEPLAEVWRAGQARLFSALPALTGRTRRRLSFRR